MSEGTIEFNTEKLKTTLTKDMILTVYKALEEKGYNPLNQLVGYFISGDPAYITSHKNARNLIMQVERDEIIEVLLCYFLKENIE